MIEHNCTMSDIGKGTKNSLARKRKIVTSNFNLFNALKIGLVRKNYLLNLLRENLKKETEKNVFFAKY